MMRRNRSRLYTVLASPITFIALLLLAGFLARAAWGIHSKARDGEARLAAAQAQAVKLEAERSVLSDRVEQLSTPAGIKAELRAKYHAVEPGESVAVIVDPSAPSVPSDTGRVSSSTDLTAPAPDAGSWWQKFLRMIGF